MTMRNDRAMSTGLKRRVHIFLESSTPGDRWGYIFDYLMVALIALNILAVILESVPSLNGRYHRAFLWFEIFSVAVFTVEYAARVWACTADRAHGYAHPIAGRIKYTLSPMAIVDFLAFAPFYLSYFFAVDLRMLRVFRMIRLLKLTRYSAALIVFAAVLRNQARALTAALFIMLTALMFASSIMFAFEHEVQPGAFGSIPDAMWWAVATLTTVGYGDVAPVTAMGKLLGGVTMIIGIGMFALPAGIMATGFAQEIRKHEFIVSWRLVAKVPLFTDLDAAHIAEIVGQLKPLVVPPRHAVVRIGEPGDSMFFVVSGELEADVSPAPQRFVPGEFFGEIGLLQNSVRIADVVSLTECQLLELTKDSFWHLVEIHPGIGDRVREVMERRLAGIDLDATTRTVGAGQD
jgi:voltage-gated potassium channel